MRLIYVSTPMTLLLCFLVWPVLQVSAALICLYLPDRVYSVRSFFFRTHAFEKDGRIYDRIFRVSRWKHLLPDGGMVFKKRGFRKKHLDSFSEENLSRFLTESARGELTHWLAILPFWVFGFFAPPEVIWCMLLYALLVNVPCIIAQRYNRPRVERLIAHLQKRRTYTLSE
jgi:glycosyl-4,4'-diaponeurosporenoate acyltransferase